MSVFRSGLIILLALALSAGCSGSCNDDGTGNNGEQDVGDTGQPDTQSDAGDTADTADTDGPPLSDPDCTPTKTLEENIDSDMTISADDGVCWSVIGKITVSAHLTIEEGVVFKFDEDGGLNIEEGALTVNGTSENPVIMTGDEEVPGYWSGLQFRNTESTDNAVSNLIIDYAGGSSFQGAASAGLALNASGIDGEPVRVSVDDTTIRNSASLGLYVESGATIVSFENNTITGGEGPAARVAAELLGSLSDTSSFAGNADDYIRVAEATLETGEYTWPALDVPYRLFGQINITADAFVTIAAGTTVEFDSGVGLNVEGGKLTAAGTSDNPVTFRGVEDLEAYWKGIQYKDTISADNRLEHVLITNAASRTFGGAGTGALVLNSSGANGAPVRLSLSNVEITKFAPGNAVYVESDTTLDACESLSGFVADDVGGDGSTDFVSNCGL